MKTIDVHCHLQHEQYDKDRAEVISEAKKRMLFVICSGARPDWNRQALKLSEEHTGFIYATLGLHPMDAEKLSEKDFEAELRFIRESAGRPRNGMKNGVKEGTNNVVGIGEIGLDYHWEKDEKKRKVQEERFIRLLKLAKDLKLPAVIHSWDAEPRVLEVLSSQGMKNVVMHCFSGKRPEFEKALSLGYMVSFSTQVCFSKDSRKFARDVPIDRILIETDSPYLDPAHGRNVPWNTEIAVRKIAEVRKTSEEEVLSHAVRNAERVFGIKARG